MDKYTKEVVQAQLNAEAAVMKELEEVYRAALDAINERIKLLQTGEITQSTIYHIEYQKTLKAQISAILDKLQADEYTSLEKYLTDNYNIGFAGSAYAMHGQGVPVLLPIDKNAVYKAIVADTKLTHPMYKEIGLDMAKLKKTVTHEISRGIASGLNYKAMARNIQAAAKIPQDRAKAIARTDGHRVLEASAEDARQAAKARGADVVKQWDATMDGNTRDTHRQLDGQIRETNEPFTLGSKSAMYPGSFGIPEEDCNCRCIATTRARWELDEDELNTLKERAAFFGLDKTNDFEEFKEKYLKASEDFPKENNSRKAAETLKKEEKSGIIKDKVEHSFEQQEEAEMSKLHELQKEIKQYDKALETNARLQDETLDFKEIIRLESEYDEIAAKRWSAVRMVDAVKEKIDSIRHEKTWYKYEKPFATLKAVADVEQAIINKGWFNGKVSLQGIPLDTAKSIAASFNRVFSTYPKLSGKLKGLHTSSLGVNTWAGFSPDTQKILIGHSIYSADVETIKKKYAQAVASGYFPIGTDYRSIFVHEMGHAIDYFIGNYKDVERISYGMVHDYLTGVAGLKSAYGNKAREYIKENVSRYADTNPKELFAECFSEYLTSQHPRDMAKWYGEKTEAEYKEWLE